MNRSLWSCVAFAGLMEGCAGGGQNAKAPGFGFSPSPPGTICPDVMYVVRLLSPAPGATNVSTAVGQIEVGNLGGGSSATYAITLTPNVGSAILRTESPSSGPDSGGFDFALPALAAETTYTVSLADMGPCHALSSAPIGSFTTQ